MTSCRFHDWCLTSILRDGERLGLTVASEDGSRSALIDLQEVRLIRMVDYSTQNIVENICDSSVHAIDRDCLSRLLVWMCSTADGGSWLSQESLGKITSEIEAGQAVLIALTPSSGAELVALCRSVTYRDSISSRQIR